MGQSTRFDDSEKTRLIDNASIGINDNPIVGEESIDCVRVIVGDRSREVVFQFQQFFLHRMFEEQSIRLTRIRLPSSVRLAKMPDMAVTLPVQAARNKPKLLDQVRDMIRRKHFSIRTEQAF